MSWFSSTSWGKLNRFGKEPKSLYTLAVKTVKDFIEELRNYPEDLPVYHYDLKEKFTTPRLEEAETVYDGERFKYVMISTEEEEIPKEVTEEEITD